MLLLSGNKMNKINKPSMFNYKFRAIYENKEFSLKAIYDHIRSIQDIFKRNELIILLTNNDLTSLSIYLYSINFKTPIMLLSSDINLEELNDIVNKYNPSYVIMKLKPDDSNNSLIKREVFQGYFIYRNKCFTDQKIFDDLALLLPTSGSTGLAKYVRISHQNIASNTHSIVKYLSINEQDVSITTLPMNYSFGLSIINTCARSGAKLILTNKSVIERDFWELIDRYKVTSLSGVPYTFSLLKKVGFFKRDWPTLRVLTQAGGRLKDDLKKEFYDFSKERKIKFFVMYGQTEATARISYVPPSKLKQKFSSAGRAIPGGKISIDKDEGLSSIGEITYEGKNVSLGYAHCALDLALGDENKGVLATGDLGYIDSDGYIFITGRKSRFIKINGVRFGLDYIEGLLEKEFPEFDLKCYGDDDNLCIDYCYSSHEDNRIIKFLSKKTRVFHKLITVRKVKQLKRNKHGKKIYN